MMSYKVWVFLMLLAVAVLASLVVGGFLNEIRDGKAELIAAITQREEAQMWRDTEVDDTYSSSVLAVRELTIDEPNSIIFCFNSEGEPYPLVISPEGFWVKGVKVEDTPEGYQEFYEAFKALLEGRECCDGEIRENNAHGNR